MHLSWDASGVVSIDDELTPDEVAETHVGVMLYTHCTHRGIRGWWHKMTDRAEHILGYYPADE